MRFKSSVKWNACQWKCDLFWFICMRSFDLMPIWMQNLNLEWKISIKTGLYGLFIYWLILTIAIWHFQIGTFKCECYCLGFVNPFKFISCIVRKIISLFVANHQIDHFSKHSSTPFQPFLLLPPFFSFCSSKWQWICNFPCISYRVVCY